MADWTRIEDELIIADYFQMLSAELKGISYNKAEHRRELLKILTNRNNSAIEFKHRNISAVLIEQGMPYIKGYQPLFKYQSLLEEEVLSVLQRQKGIDKTFNLFATEKVAKESPKLNYAEWSIKAPSITAPQKIRPRTFNPVKRNYLEIEQRNQSLGELGERLVFDYEVWKLHKAELPKLAKEVKWVSKELGDGAGFDILSKDVNGKDMYIEVKTTKLGKESPIFFSSSEYEFSKLKTNKFFLYRVFDVKENPTLFIKKGMLNNICSQIEATNFKGYF